MTQDTVTLSYLEQYAPALIAEMVSLALSLGEDDAS